MRAFYVRRSEPWQNELEFQDERYLLVGLDRLAVRLRGLLLGRVYNLKVYQLVFQFQGK